MKEVWSRKNSLTGRILRMLRVDRFSKKLSTQEEETYVNNLTELLSELNFNRDAMEAARIKAEHNIALAYSYLDEKERFRLLR